jgi:hypothetical protein
MRPEEKTDTMGDENRCYSLFMVHASHPSQDPTQWATRRSRTTMEDWEQGKASGEGEGYVEDEGEGYVEDEGEGDKDPDDCEGTEDGDGEEEGDDGEGGARK